MKLIQRLRAFTLVELLVVMSIIAIIAGLAFPAITGAVTQSQLTQVLSNARQIHLAAQRAALDGAASGDVTLAWPGTNYSDLKAYTAMLADNDYLPNASFSKVWTAPGANGVTGKADITTDNIAFNVYKVDETNDANTVFLATKNFTAVGTAISGVPFSDKGFVTFRKGGDGGIYKKGQVSNTNAFGIIISSKF
jgi:prepilin-type N-terminal cleavage/methylation domain-containing protein